MLEVQLCRRFRNGVVIPLARDDSPVLVRSVAKAMLRKMEGWRFDDEALDALAEQERQAFVRALEAEGLKCGLR